MEPPVPTPGIFLAIIAQCFHKATNVGILQGVLMDERTLTGIGPVGHKAVMNISHDPI